MDGLNILNVATPPEKIREDKYEWNTDILKIGGGVLAELIGGGKVTQHVELEELFITRQEQYVTRGLSYPQAEGGFDFSLGGLIGAVMGGGAPNENAAKNRVGAPERLANVDDPWENVPSKKSSDGLYEPEERTPEVQNIDGDNPIGPYSNIPNLDGDTYSSNKQFAQYIDIFNDWATRLPIGGIDDTATGGANSLVEYVDTNVKEQSRYGLPVYFKDLRDNNYIYFQGYVEGLSETVSPSWNSENYVGRSEPVYTYTGAEREISFTLKLAAQSRQQLDMIYEKLDRLTSLCYPEYKLDTVEQFNKVRMKPPLTKFRLGELWGSQNNEMVGFIKSLSYEIPEESPWETMNGKRVPHYIFASIGFQVIHTEVPSIEYARDFPFDIEGKKSDVKNLHKFYGLTQNLSNAGGD